MGVRCPRCHSENTDTSKFCSSCAAPLGSEAPGPPSVTKTVATPVAGVSKGSVIAGKYKILEEIGRGGMGVVYKAEDTKLQRMVALKFLPVQWTTDPEARERFIQEARAASALDHPNICTIHEIDETEDGHMYISMAFYEGESLREKIKRGPLDKNEALDIAIQVTQGMAKAHTKGIVHRDIKPANILITNDGVAKIVDFGLAKLAGQVRLTKEGSTVGTVAYMSPEQLKGEPVDQRTDIWSLGVVLYEMVSGRLPFKGDLEQSLIHSILTSDPQLASKIRKDLPKGLEQVIFKSLMKNPPARYQSIDELLEDLNAIAEGLKPLRAKAGLFQGKVFGIKKPYACIGLTILVIFAALWLLFLSPKREQAPSPDAIPSVAVLPFADMSSAKDQDYFGEGLAEELINALARVQGLRVVARTSAFALKGLNLDVREVGKMLGVRAVLEGSVRKAGNRLRVMAQLVDAGTGLHLWSERFDREERDVFDIQDEISLAIVEHLKVTLLAGEKTTLNRRSTADTEAYNLYLKGLYFSARPSPESLGKALDFFHEALDRDPNFAQAHAGVATVYLTMANLNLAPPAEMYQKAKAALKNTFALDPDLPEAHGLAATLEFYFEWNWTAAEESFGRVLALSPGNAFGHMAYAWLLMSRRRFEESLVEIKRALTLDPLMPLFYACSIGLHVGAGRYDEALGEFAKSRQIEPNFGLAYFHAGTAYYFKGLIDEAIESFQKARQLAIIPGWGESLLLLCYLKKGDRGKAERTLAEMLEDRKKLPVSPVCLAWGLAALGDFDGAFKWLETGIQERDGLMPFIHIYTELYVPALARDPRFGAILDRLGLPR